MKRKVHSEIVRQDLRVAKKQAGIFARSSKWKKRISQTVTQEVKDWLRESTTSHWYLFEKDRDLYIAFHDHNEAMRFKLAWH